MSHKLILLIDQSATEVAALDMRFREKHYEGTISLDGIPPQLRLLFERFEEVVEGQMFSLLDDIEEKIGTSLLRVRFDDGGEAFVADLQVFPSTNSVSFKVHQATVPLQSAG